MEEKNKKPAFQKLFFVLLAIALIAASAGAFYIYKNNKDLGTGPSDGWVEYKNEKHKLRFTYPQNWGDPEFREIETTKGKSYSIFFSYSQGQTNNIERTHGIVLAIDTDDMVRKVCDANDSNHCAEVKAITSKEVKSLLSANKSLIPGDISSYVAISSAEQEASRTISLGVYKIVDLKILNISAVRSSYDIHGAPDTCLPDNFSTSGSKDCITKEVYEDLSRVVKSIQSLES